MPQKSHSVIKSADKAGVETKAPALSVRPPVIAIMGHIDHGKSSLLDFIRKSNIVADEAGGITQHIGAYEVAHEAKTANEKNEKIAGKKSRITFLDTPGHAAFKGIRSRGAGAADIAVLVVSGEEGVKPQTVEALQSIQAAKIPYIVAITKTDSPKTNLERIKQNLAENEIYLESYGGQIPWVAVSSVTGEGVSELLDLLLLQAELGELRGDPNALAEGVIIEANVDKKKGVSATLIIKNGTLRNGMTVVCDASAGKDSSIAPVRFMEDWNGKRVTEATFSSPIRLIGFDLLPKVGARFTAYANKKDAEEAIEAALSDLEQQASKKQLAARQPLSRQPVTREPAPGQPLKNPSKQAPSAASDKSEIKPAVVPIVLKADAAGSLEAIEGELKKIAQPHVELKLIQAGIGDIMESDVKAAVGGTSGNGEDGENKKERTLVIGFNNRIDPLAKAAAERLGVEITTFDIIYKLVEAIEAIVVAKTPKVQVEEITGKAKIQKLFSKNKDKQVVGGRVLEGVILAGAEVIILRRDVEIGQGKIRELQQQKNKASEAKKDTEFGALIESRVEIAPGDQIQSVQLVTK